MKLKFAMPIVEGRGAGLGNEMIIWAKAFIGAQALGLRLLDPAWGLNHRNYARFFRSPRLDWAGHAALRAALPVYRFEESDFHAEPSGDMDLAVRRFSDRHGIADKQAYILGFSGLWGGLSALAGARQFLLSKLLTTRFTVENLYKIERRFSPGRLRVGLHVRRGDFSSPLPLDQYAGKFNVAVPIDWYVRLASQITQHFAGRATFLVVSDGSADELAPLTQNFECVTTSHLMNTDISDMLALAACDFIGCSISSFSLWAAYFSQGRYGWFQPNLTVADGLGSIWGHEDRQATPAGETYRSIAQVRELLQLGAALRPRGVPIGPDGALPDELLQDLELRLAVRRAETDLMKYGAVPV